jgi:D-sedoheptulose 7-phosphate isomerase
MLTTDLTQIDQIIKALKAADFIWIIGNGGSAAQADHLACDLVKNAKIKAVALTSFSIASAIANDYGTFDIVFSKQLENGFDFDRDVLICLSTSGESKNLIRAAKYIYDNGGKVITITGAFASHKGGYIRNFATHSLLLGSEDQQECEDLIGEICHKIYKMLIK